MRPRLQAECSPDYQPVQHIQMENPVSSWRTSTPTVVSQGEHWSMNFPPGKPQSYLQPMISPCSFYLVAPKWSCLMSCHIPWWSQHLKSVTNHHLLTSACICRIRLTCTSILAGFCFNFMTVILWLFCHCYSPPPPPFSWHAKKEKKKEKRKKERSLNIFCG